MDLPVPVLLCFILERFGGVGWATDRKDGGPVKSAATTILQKKFTKSLLLATGFIWN